jgi:hypothetical protein
MLLSIPYQALEIGNIHLTPFESDRYGKAIAKLAYKDSSVEFHDVSIMTPPLKVIDYNPENSRLRIDLSEEVNFQNKINTLQEYLASTFYTHQQIFLGHKNQSRESIHSLFHFLLDGTILYLYAFPTSLVRKSDGTTCNICNLVSGDFIRCVVRLQGVSQIQTRYGNRLRLHHSISSIWLNDTVESKR